MAVPAINGTAVSLNGYSASSAMALTSFSTTPGVPANVGAT